MNMEAVEAKQEPTPGRQPLSGNNAQYEESTETHHEAVIDPSFHNGRNALSPLALGPKSSIQDPASVLPPPPSPEVAQPEMPADDQPAQTASGIPNDDSSAPPATVSETTQTETKNSAPESAVASAESPVAALQQVPGESNNSFAIFIRYASAVPHPSLLAFAKQIGVSRSSLTRWREAYRWDARLAEYHRRCSKDWIEPAPAPPSPPETAEQAMQLDLRANAMRLARLALESWDPDSNTTSLQGVIRALELACKLNPPPPAPNASKLAADRRNHAEFLARLEKIYGPDPNPSPCQH